MERKSSVRRKTAPQIKQTKASAYRILKSNPLMMQNQDNIKKLGLKNTTDIPKSVDVLGITSKYKNENQRCNKPKNVVNKNLDRPKNNTDVGLATNTAAMKKPPRLSITAMYRNSKNPTRRRSKSAERFDPNVYLRRSIFEEATSRAEWAQSLEDVRQEPTLTNIKNVLSPILKKKVTFKSPSPSNYRRRITRCEFSNSTPSSSNVNIPCSVLIDINENEEENQNKINFNVSIERSNSGNEFVARNALYDFKELIGKGFTPEECEVELGLISQGYERIEDEPLYWECRALLEQNKGNISVAVEHYRKAIIQGAEIETITKSLDGLLQKLNLPMNPDAEIDCRNRERLVLGVRNAFVNTVIQLALREKNSKWMEYEKQPMPQQTPPRRRRSTIYMLRSSSSSVKISSSVKNNVNTIEMTEHVDY